MIEFEEIRNAAIIRHGSQAVEARMPVVKTQEELRDIPSDRLLSMMSLRIFRAGLKHSVVDGKWPAFEEVFHGFDVPRVAAMGDEDIESLLGDARLIRHMGKLRAVRHNAMAMQEIGDFAGWIADWPGSDIVGLWAALGKRMSQLGGNFGPMFLRMAGKDTFVLTPSVTSAFGQWKLADTPLGGKSGARVAQAVFNAYVEETGLPLAHLSMIMAMSVD